MNFESFTTVKTNLSHVLSAGKQGIKKLKLIGALVGKLRMQREQHPDAVGIWRKIVYTYDDGCQIVLEGEGFESGGDTPYIEGPLGKVYKGFRCTIPDIMEKLAEMPDPAPQNTDFLECVRTRSKFALDEQKGHRSSTLVNLGACALRLNRTLHFDPDKQLFIGDDAAIGAERQGPQSVAEHPAFDFGQRQHTDDVTRPFGQEKMRAMAKSLLDDTLPARPVEEGGIRMRKHIGIPACPVGLDQCTHLDCGPIGNRGKRFGGHVHCGVRKTRSTRSHSKSLKSCCSLPGMRCRLT